MPCVLGDDRRVVLDHLGNRFGQWLVSHWAFVRFAREQGFARRSDVATRLNRRLVHPRDAPYLSTFLCDAAGLPSSLSMDPEQPVTTLNDPTIHWPFHFLHFAAF